MRWLSYRIMRMLGWKIEGSLPEAPKMVIVGAPHTSNWDFFLFLAVLYHLEINVSFLGKHTLFRWPFGAMFRKVGGIPVNRSSPGGIVASVKRAFDAVDEMILVVTPEATRSAAKKWKSGFVEIAEGADVPVVLAGVDSANRKVVIGPAHLVGPNRAQFMDRVRSFYSDKDGIRPSGKGPVRLGGESVSS